MSTQMAYCNYGYMLLGEIVRRVSGKSLDSFFTERIFEPLGMKDTYLVVPEHVWDRVVNYPEDSVSGKWTSTPEGLKNPSSAGGVYSTVNDMCIFGQMFLNEGEYGNNRILSKASVRAMIRNHTHNIPSQWNDIRFLQSGWGLGFMISISKKDNTGTLRSPEAYGHTGWGCSYLLMDPVYNVVLVYFQVTMKMPGDRLDRKFDIFTDVALAGIEEC